MSSRQNDKGKRRAFPLEHLALDRFLREECDLLRAGTWPFVVLPVRPVELQEPILGGFAPRRSLKATSLYSAASAVGAGMTLI